MALILNLTTLGQQEGRDIYLHGSVAPRVRTAALNPELTISLQSLEAEDKHHTACSLYMLFKNNIYSRQFPAFVLC